MPRTPDGQPDLQGFWTNDTVTPLERPAEFGNKETLTPEEAAAYAKKRRDQFLAQPKDNIHYDDAIWQDEHYTKEELYGCARRWSPIRATASCRR